MRLGNDKKMLIRALKLGLIDRGTMNFVDVEHDKGCPQLLHVEGACSCNPSVFIVDKNHKRLARVLPNGMVQGLE